MAKAKRFFKDPKKKGTRRAIQSSFQGKPRKSFVEYFGTCGTKADAETVKNKLKNHHGANNARVSKSAKGYDIWVND